MTFVQQMDNRLLSTEPERKSNGDLSSFPRGTFKEDGDTLFTLSDQAVLMYDPKYKTVGIWYDGGLLPTPGFIQLNRSRGPVGAPTSNPAKTFHDTLTYLQSPKGIFTLLLCASEEIYCKYFLSVCYDSLNTGHVENDDDEKIMTIKYTAHGVLMNDKLVTTFIEAVDIIEHMSW